MQRVLTILFAVSLSTVAISEDLRLAPDGVSLLAVNVVTNTVTRDVLAKAEQDAMLEIANAKQAAANAEFKLSDIRRYLTTLDAMLKMKRDGTNVVHVPISLPTNTIVAAGTNGPVSVSETATPVPNKIKK